jgi:hypothetical protein
VFTTRHGTPNDPRNFNRSFDRWVQRQHVPDLGQRDADPARGERPPGFT